MNTFEEIDKDRKELEFKMTELVNEFQKKWTEKTSHRLSLRITHNERSFSSGLHNVYVNLSM